MTTSPEVLLLRGDVVARVLPGEGGALVDLTLAGRPVLARTPWADRVTPSPHPATTEAEWVGRWRGGWQLCFPTAGQPNLACSPTESFHGAASLSLWHEVSRSADTVDLCWADEDGLTAQRVWRITDDGVVVATSVQNTGEHDRTLVIAEHLILGGDVLSAPVFLDVPSTSLLRPLDYAGLPEGSISAWPGPPAERWTTVDRGTPARVAGLKDVLPQRIRLQGEHVGVTVQWRGSALPHALLWEELGVSTEYPWNGGIMALGIEPSSTPHGAGTSLNESLVHLAPGGLLEWEVSLSVHWAYAPSPVPSTMEAL